MTLLRPFHLAIVIAGIWLIAGCESKSESDAPQRAGAVAFEPAAPLELEPRSYAASQRDHYNRIYAQPESARPEPNEFLVQCLDRIDAMNVREADASTRPAGASARTALDIAMGDGRNTIALAQHGYRTTGFDMADVGVNRARRRAVELGLTIDARVDFFGDAYLEPNSWDVVAMMYFSVDDNDLQRIKRAVRPGGWLIMEFAGSHPDNDVLRDFFDWQIIVYEMDWGERQWELKRPVTGTGMRTRLLVRRPPAEES